MVRQIPNLSGADLIMLKRVVHLSLISLSFSLPALSCTSGGDDNGLSFGSFSTTQSTSFSTTVEGEEEEESGSSGDGDGDTSPGDGDGDPGDGDPGDGDPGDGDPGDGDGDDTSCPPGEFGCPCDNGECAAGLQCNMGECTLGGGDGDGDGDPTTGGGDDPWDPEMCAMPGIPVTITGVDGSACSAPCVEDLDCPAGPAGTDPACVLVLEGAMDPDHCALLCDPLNDACSVGASCKEVQPGVGICTYP
jgi:hypothetical protein